MRFKETEKGGMEVNKIVVRGKPGRNMGNEIARRKYRRASHRRHISSVMLGIQYFVTDCARYERVLINL